MRTAIITRKDQTTLNIVTSEELYLEQVNGAGEHVKQIKLTRGTNNVPVDAGVFRVMSKAPVTVSADAPDVQVTTIPGDKDGGSIDPLVKNESAPQ